MKTSLKLAIFLVCIFITSNLFAQRPGGPRDELLKVKMQKFMEALQVDSATAVRYFNSAFENRKAINQLNKKRVRLLEDIESNVDASDIDSKLDQMEDIEVAITNQRKAFLTELRTILTPKQIAQAMILEKKFGKKLKEEINKRKEDRDE